MSKLRPPRKSGARLGLVSVLFAGYTAFILVVTLSPSQVDSSVQGWVYRFVAAAQRLGAPAWFDYDAVEFSANVGMFIPFGFMLALLLPAQWAWVSILAAAALSTGIEFFQKEFLPQRVFDPRDIIANSLGGLVGFILAASLRAIVHARDKRVIARAVWLNDRGFDPTG